MTIKKGLASFNAEIGSSMFSTSLKNCTLFGESTPTNEQQEIKSFHSRDSLNIGANTFEFHVQNSTQKKTQMILYFENIETAEWNPHAHQFEINLKQASLLSSITVTSDNSLLKCGKDGKQEMAKYLCKKIKSISLTFADSNDNATSFKKLKSFRFISAKDSGKSFKIEETAKNGNKMVVAKANSKAIKNEKVGLILSSSEYNSRRRNNSSEFLYYHSWFHYCIKRLTIQSRRLHQLRRK